MSTEQFLRLRLGGARFDGHAVPFDFLKDLAVLEEMVVEAAKWKFLADHPNRKRSPRGLTRGIHLGLEAVEPGSAALSIQLALEQPLLPPPSGKSYLEVARDTIISAIDAAAREQSGAEHLPARILSYFDKMGRSLKEDETVEFSNPDRRVTATLTKNVLQRLIFASSHVEELAQVISIRGAVPEADQDEMTFKISIDGRKIQAPMEPWHLNTVLGAFEGFKSGIRVLCRGIGRFRDERLLGFDTVERLRILDALDVGEQLDEMRLMEDGWLEGGGLAPPAAGLDWLSRSFDRRFPEDAPLPHLYPTEAGGVQAEWSLGPNEVTFEVNLNTHYGEWHALNMETDAVSERTLNCDDGGDWEWLAAQIKAMSRGGA